MGLNCACPITALPDLVDVTCPVDFDQVVKLAFTLSKTDSDFDETSGNEIDNETAWTTRLAASDATKIQVSPAIANLTAPPSEGAFIGGNDNSTVDGMAYYVGEDNVRIPFEIHSAPQATIDAMDALSCLSDATLGQSRLTVFMLTRRIKGSSFVLAKPVGEGSTAGYNGIPIYNFRISTVGLDGYNSKNKYMGSFDMKADDFRAISATKILFSPFALANA